MAATKQFPILNPIDQSVIVLIAEQESLKAAQDFIAEENAKDHPSFYYHIDTITSDSDALHQPGIHYIYAPDLSPDAIKETVDQLIAAGHPHIALKVRPKTILPEVNSIIDIRGGAGINNFADKIASRSAANEPYLLMNTPGVNASATSELAIAALMDGLCGFDFNSASIDAAMGNWTSHNLANPNNPYKAHAGELAGKSIAILGMGNIGICTARRLKALGAYVIGWGYVRADGTESFTIEDATNMGIGHATSTLDACGNAEGIILHVPLTESTRDLVNTELLTSLTKDKVTLVNVARGEVTNKQSIKDAIKNRHATGQALYYYEDSDYFKDHGPGAETVALFRQYPQYVRFTPHWGGDRTPETDYNVAMQSFRQLSACIWEHHVFNAKTTVPEGYEDLGSKTPSHIGRVTTHQLQHIVRDYSSDIQANLAILMTLIERTQMQTLTPEEWTTYHQTMNHLLHSHEEVAGRPFALQMTRDSA